MPLQLGRALALALAIATLVVLPRPLHAQEDEPEPAVDGMRTLQATAMGGGIGRITSEAAPTIHARSLARYAEVLGLSPEQVEALRTLHDGYLANLRAYRERMQTALDALRQRIRDQPTGFGGMNEIRDYIQKHRAEKEKLDSTFLADLRSLLTKEQERNWDAFERLHRRETEMRLGFLSGERTDVVRLVEELGLSAEQRASLKPTIDAYELDLDRELRNRIKVRASIVERMNTIVWEPEKDAPTARQMVQDVQDAAARIRDLNRRYLRMVRESLPAEAHGDFDRRVRLAEYPDVYRPGLTERSLAAAAGFADLSADQRKDLDAIRASFADDLAGANTDLAQATEDSEYSFRLGYPDEARDARLTSARKRRAELDRSTLERLKGMLTAEQTQRLPQPPERAGSR